MPLHLRRKGIIFLESVNSRAISTLEKLIIAIPSKAA
jgi:hypothetical protein